MYRPTTARLRIQLPTTQWYSNRWAVQWRRGRDHQDVYEVTHQGQFVASVVVTRAGWKWTAPNPRSKALLPPWVWSDDIFATWQDAVLAFAKQHRRRAAGRGALLPDQWSAMVTRGRTKPWTPRPVHDDFDAWNPAHQ